MKTKLPVKKNCNPTKEELAIRKAIHILQDTTGDSIVLMQENDVYLIPDIQNDGIINYSVCDGLPGQRSFSYDCFTLRKAMKVFKKVVSESW